MIGIAVIFFIYMLLDNSSNTFVMTLRKNYSMEAFCNLLRESIDSGHLYHIYIYLFSFTKQLLVGDWLITPAYNMCNYMY